MLFSSVELCVEETPPLASGSSSLPFPPSWCLFVLVNVFPICHIPPPRWSSLFFQVPEVISSIRQVSKSALKDDAKPKQEAEEAFYNSQKFEVLYCGKVEVKLLTCEVFFLTFDFSED